MQSLKTQGCYIFVLLALRMLTLRISWMTHPSCKALTDNIFCIQKMLYRKCRDKTRKLVPLAALKRPMQKTMKEYRKLLLTWLMLKRLALLLTVLSTTSAKHRNALWIQKGRWHAANRSLDARATLLHWQQKIELVRLNVIGGRIVQSPQFPIKCFLLALSPMDSWKQKVMYMHVYFSIYFFFCMRGTYIKAHMFI